jgi:hypothetical protein
VCIVEDIFDVQNADMKAALESVHSSYIEYLMNPFSLPDSNAIINDSSGSLRMKIDKTVSNYNSSAHLTAAQHQ